MKTIKINKLELWGKDNLVESGESITVEDTPAGRQKACDYFNFEKVEYFESEFDKFINGKANDVFRPNEYGDYDEPTGWILTIEEK